MNTHVLIKRTTCFYDGHGNPDTGGELLEISNNEKYLNLEENIRYVESTHNDSVDEIDDDYDKDFSAEDGYNFCVEYFKIKYLTGSQATLYQTIINGYNELLPLL
jgi:hypothetical protein